MEKICELEVCGKTFTAQRSSRKYCCEAHRVAAFRKPRVEKVEVEVEVEEKLPDAVARRIAYLKEAREAMKGEPQELPSRPDWLDSPAIGDPPPGLV